MLSFLHPIFCMRLSPYLICLCVTLMNALCAGRSDAVEEEAYKNHLEEIKEEIKTAFADIDHPMVKEMEIHSNMINIYTPYHANSLFEETYESVKKKPTSLPPPFLSLPTRKKIINQYGKKFYLQSIEALSVPLPAGAVAYIALALGGARMQPKTLLSRQKKIASCMQLSKEQLQIFLKKAHAIEQSGNSNEYDPDQKKGLYFSNLFIKEVKRGGNPQIKKLLSGAERYYPSMLEKLEIKCMKRDSSYLGEFMRTHIAFVCLTKFFKVDLVILHIFNQLINTLLSYRILYNSVLWTYYSLANLVLPFLSINSDFYKNNIKKKSLYYQDNNNSPNFMGTEVRSGEYLGKYLLYAARSSVHAFRLDFSSIWKNNDFKKNDFFSILNYKPYNYDFNPSHPESSLRWALSLSYRIPDYLEYSFPLFVLHKISLLEQCFTVLFQSYYKWYQLACFAHEDLEVIYHYFLTMKQVKILLEQQKIQQPDGKEITLKEQFPTEYQHLLKLSQMQEFKELQDIMKKMPNPPTLWDMITPVYGEGIHKMMFLYRLQQMPKEHLHWFLEAVASYHRITAYVGIALSMKLKAEQSKRKKGRQVPLAFVELDQTASHAYFSFKEAHHPLRRKQKNIAPLTYEIGRETKEEERVQAHLLIAAASSGKSQGIANIISNLNWATTFGIIFAKEGQLSPISHLYYSAPHADLSQELKMMKSLYHLITKEQAQSLCIMEHPFSTATAAEQKVFVGYFIDQLIHAQTGQLLMLASSNNSSIPPYIQEKKYKHIDFYTIAKIEKNGSLYQWKRGEQPISSQHILDQHFKKKPEINNELIRLLKEASPL